MKPKEYMAVQIAVMEIGKRASVLDLDAFLTMIDRAETIGPIMDPTKARDAQANLTAIKELAREVKKVQVAFAKVMQAVIETSARMKVPHEVRE